MKKEKNQMSIEQDKKIESSTSILLIFKNAILKSSKFLLIVSLLVLFNIGSKYPAMSESIIEDKTKINEISETQYPLLVRARLYESLVKEVNKYIQSVAPGNRVNAHLLVKLCIKYNVDINFVIAQGVLESHLGTKGKAAVTNSVWNVGSYDDGRVLFTYRDPNESIEPYLILLTERYLGDNKTISDLLKDRRFVNLNGYRYASAPNYEAKLRTFILHLNMNTSIPMYQDILKLSDEKILSYFSPVEQIIDNELLIASIY